MPDSHIHFANDNGADSRDGPVAGSLDDRAQGGTEAAGNLHLVSKARRFWPFLDSQDLSDVKVAPELVGLIAQGAGVTRAEAVRRLQAWMQGNGFHD